MTLRCVAARGELQMTRVAAKRARGEPKQLEGWVVRVTPRLWGERALCAPMAGLTCCSRTVCTAAALSPGL